MFIFFSDSKDRLFGKPRRDKLESDRKSVCHPAWQRQRRKTGEMCRNGKDIFKIHGERILRFLPEAKRGSWSCRGCDDVNILERFFKIFFYFCPHLLCFFIIPIVIPRS